MKYWCKRTELQLNQKLCAIQTDMGGVFQSKEFANWVRGKGITHRVMNPASSAENGRIERQNRKIQTMICAMLLDANLKSSY